jgi:hypothetical protein
MPPYRLDPGSIHTIDFPVDYQVLGTDGKNLVASELLHQAEDMQLNAVGVPPQFYRGTLDQQTAPMAARLFEAHWQHLVSAGETFLKWVNKKVSDELGWKPLGIRLTKPKIADNMDHLMLMLQLMQTGKISDTTILERLGRDITEELRRKKDDQIREMKTETQIREEADKVLAGSSLVRQAVEEQRAMTMQAQGAPTDSGSPMGAPAGAPPADPLAEIMAQIEAFGHPEAKVSIMEQFQIAQEAAAILAPMPDQQKKQKLREIDQINKPMGDLIRTQMDEVHKQRRQEFITQGEAMLEQHGGHIPPMGGGF